MKSNVLQYRLWDETHANGDAHKLSLIISLLARRIEYSANHAFVAEMYQLAL